METVWIAGASRGLGAALAHVVSASGCRVVLTARNASDLEALRATLPHPENSVVVQADLAAPGSLPSLVDRVWNESGGIQRAFFCAGLAQWSNPLTTTPAAEEQLLTLNYRFPVQAAKLLAERMLARGSGQLVAVGSIAAEFGQPESAAYGASKAALERHWEAFYAAWTHRGLRVQLMQPGVIQTTIMANALDESGAALGQNAKSHTGQSPEAVAQRLWAAAQTHRFKTYLISPTERLALLLHRWMPTLFYTLLRKRHGTA